MSLVGISSDWLFPARDVRVLAEKIEQVGVRCDYTEFESSHGHDGFLAEVDAIAAVVSGRFHARRIALVGPRNPGRVDVVNTLCNRGESYERRHRSKNQSVSSFPSHLLRDRVAIITGGSRGIGRATAQRLGAGAHVVVNYLSNAEEAHNAVNEARDLGVRALALQGDVSQGDQANALVEKTLGQFGRVDLLVANAGIWEGAPVEDMTDDMWDKVIDHNLRGTWTVCRAAVPALKRQGNGLHHRELDGWAAWRAGVLQLCSVEGRTDQLREVARGRAGAHGSGELCCTGMG